MSKETVPNVDTGRVSHVPASLLFDLSQSSTSVWAWGQYEGLGKGKHAWAGRDFLAAKLGCGLTQVDEARRPLIAGGWLERILVGRRLNAQHKVLRRSKDTGERFAAVPDWAADRVRLKPDPALGMVRPDAWRIYACAILTQGTNPELWGMTAAKIGSWIGVSAKTGARRLAEMEAAGWFEVIAAPGGRLTIRIALDPERAAWNAAWYAEHGRQVDAEGLHRQEVAKAPCGQIPRVTPDRFRESPRTDSETPYKTDVLRQPSIGSRTSYTVVDLSVDVQVGARTREDTVDENPTPETFVINDENFPITPKKAAWLQARRPDLTDVDITKHHRGFIGEWDWKDENFTAETWDRLWRGWMHIAFPYVTEDWMPSDAAWAQASVDAPDVDLIDEVTEFIAYCVSQDRRFKDANVIWLNRVRDAQADLDDELQSAA